MNWNLHTCTNPLSVLILSPRFVLLFTCIFFGLHSYGRKYSWKGEIKCLFQTPKYRMEIENSFHSHPVLVFVPSYQIRDCEAVSNSPLLYRFRT